MRSFKAGKLGDIGKGYKALSETELEIARLRPELAKGKMERGIIKKAAAYFAKDSQRGTR